MSRSAKAVPLIILCALIIAVPSVWANWVQDGVALCTATERQIYPVITSDGAGGAIVSWRDLRSGIWAIYAQRVNNSGFVQWTVDGVTLSTAAGSLGYQAITSDGAGGAIVAWEDSIGGIPDIYAQRVNASGAVQWTADGVALCMAPGLQWNPKIISDGAGGAIVAWQDNRSGSWDIYAQRVNVSGAVQWMADGVALCTVAGQQYYPDLISDGAGGAIVTWDDDRGDIYSQRVNASGAVQWTADGVALSTAAGEQSVPKIISDGAGGAIVTWIDLRSGNYDIYAQRVNTSGFVQWTADGVALSTAAGSQGYQAITSDGAGGAIVTWEDSISGSPDIYAQRVNASGAVQWTADGVALCMAPGLQWNPKIISDSAGGAIVAWQDNRSGSWDIYTQWVNASGAVQWTADGVALCTVVGDQTYPAITSNGAGGAIVTWSDDRSGNNDIYAQWTGNQPIATLLQSYTSSVSDQGITVTWTLAEMDADVEFFILRNARGTQDFIELSTVGLVREGLAFEFIDRYAEPGTTYKYRVDIQMENERKTLFETEPVEAPAVPMTLYQNHPNPFNPSTMISYYVAVASTITLDIYDSSGRLVVRLIDSEKRPKGANAVEWRGVDGQGRPVSSGVYFYRLTTGKQTYSKKMVLLR
ncbi:MAG: T9SS type A sorting domain-containing protein [Candidatus Krumholzibacteria bacterium]|nr:T9SS type A sorting domain-containing protein [Candidatus Krumholzibacteria bacterium]